MADEKYIKMVVGISRGLSGNKKAGVLDNVRYTHIDKTTKKDRVYPYVEIGGKLEESNLALSDHSASISKIEYDKAMFRPGYVYITLSVTSTGTSTGTSKPVSLQSAIKARFFNKYTFLDLVAVADGVQAGSCSFSDVIYLARNYYVRSFDVTALKSQNNTKEYVVVLKCYSFDINLTLSKYSRVYTGHHLVNVQKDGNNVVTPSVISSGISHLDSVKGYLDDIVKEEASVVGSREKTEMEDIYFNTKDSLLNISYRNLFMLGYEEKSQGGEIKTAKRTENDNNNELKHPYLVQYNESFYDFFAREAHKCGEFFYFENGRITVGLPYSTRLRLFDKEPAGNTDQNKYQILKLNHLCSYKTVGTDDFEHINPYCGDYIHTPTDGTGTPTSSSKYFSSGFTSDEALHVVTKEDNRYRHNKGPLLGDWILYKAIGTYVTSDTFWEGAISALGNMAWDFLNMGAIIPGLINANYKTKHLDKDGNPITTEVNKLPTLSSDAEKELGAALIANLCNSHFYQVDCLEKQSAGALVNVNLETLFRKIYLGGCVCLENIDDSPLCVVMSMHGECSREGGTSNSFEAVPFIKLSSQGSLKNVAVPVAEQVEHILKADPMEAIVTDNEDPLRLGRVRVRYPWQPEDTSDKSPWLRVEVPFAGGSSDHAPGFCMTPSKGEHVMLEYVDGNIEFPVVSGSLYYLSSKERKQDRIPPVGDCGSLAQYFNTDHQIRTIASSKGHALVFQDFANTSLFTQTLPVLGPIFQGIMKGKTGSVSIEKQGGMPIQGGSVTLRDGTGITTITLSPGSREIAINSTMGKVTMNAFTGITINAPNGDISIKGKNISLEAGNNITIQAGKNLGEHEKHVVGDTIGTVLGQILSSCIVGSLKSAHGIDLGNTCDLSFLRSCLETFMRPVEGTLSIKSKRNVVMTAGKGKITVPTSLISDAKTFDRSKGLNPLSPENQTEFKKQHDNYTKVSSFFESIFDDVKTYYIDYRVKIMNLNQTVANFRQLILNHGNNLPQIKEDYKSDRFSTHKLIIDFCKNYKKKNLKDIFGEDEPNDVNLRTKQTFCNNLNAYAKAVCDAYNAINVCSYSNFIKNNNQFINLKTCDYADEIKKGLKVDNDDLNKDKFSTEYKENKSFCGDNDNISIPTTLEIQDQIKLVRRYIAIRTLLNFKLVKLKDITNDENALAFMSLTKNWSVFVGKIQIAAPPEPQSKFWANFGQGVLKGFGGNPLDSVYKLCNRGGVSGPRAWSDPALTGGSIMISSTGDHFYQLDDAEVSDVVPVHDQPNLENAIENNDRRVNLNNAYPFKKTNTYTLDGFKTKIMVADSNVEINENNENNENNEINIVG